MSVHCNTCLENEVMGTTTLRFLPLTLAVYASALGNLPIEVRTKLNSQDVL